MKIPEHLALSCLLAQLGVQEQYGPGGTALMIAAGFFPDLDGVSLLGGWRLYRVCHRMAGHGILVTLGGPALLAALGSFVLQLGPLWPLWAWLQLALLAHLFSDVAFYGWPVQLFWPFSNRAWGFGLIAWNDLVPTLLLYLGMAVCLAFPAAASRVAGGVSAMLLSYIGWRALRPRPRHGWRGWLTGNWAPRVAPVWRWLTGDFVT